ncbi:hypothetical protein [Marinobacter fonticola]|uniref:hypothetical protein n=1 Tax=Marinobacter fonticola TaxID=2603215 RepID=UPI0011E84CEB|nr:hypothetical protein [Marinobacter fonticola]
MTVAPVSCRQLNFADDVAVRLASSEKLLLWIKGEPGSGKTTFLQQNVPNWPFPSLWLDLRREHDLMADDTRAMRDAEVSMALPPVLVLDDMSPRDLALLLADPLHPASYVVPGFPGPILLVSNDIENAARDVLSARTGRDLQTLTMPASSFELRLSILRAWQSGIERRLGVCIEPEALERAAQGRAPTVTETPGAAIQLLEAAATRVCLHAKHGEPQLRALKGQVEDLNRALLVAQARGGNVESIQSQLAHIEIEHAAYAVDWYERELAGKLCQVTARDVAREVQVLQKRTSSRSFADKNACDGKVSHTSQMVCDPQD